MSISANSLFSYKELAEEGCESSVEFGDEYLESAPVQDALNVVQRILNDDLACLKIYGPLGELFHESITVTDVLAEVQKVKAVKFDITVMDDASMGKAYMQCLPVPNAHNPAIIKPVLLFNDKYIKKTKAADLQMYFLVCKLLHEIGHTLTPGLVKLSPVCAEGQSLETPEKMGTNMIANKKFAADCGAAIEEIAYGGRVRTGDCTTTPFKLPLRVTIRKFTNIPPGPGNYTVRRIDTTYVSMKVAELKAYLKAENALFPGLNITDEAMSEVLESSLAATEEKAIARMVGKKQKRSAEWHGCEESGASTEEDPEFQELVDIGVAFSAAQVKRMAQGYKI